MKLTAIVFVILLAAIAGHSEVTFNSSVGSSNVTREIKVPNAAEIGLRIQGAASQTGDLLQFKNSTGTVLTSFDSSGAFSGGGGGGDVTSVFGRTGAVVAVNNDYTWAKIDKTISSLANLATRSSAELSDGTNLAKLNTDNTFSASLYPANSVSYALGASGNRWTDVWSGNFHVRGNTNRIAFYDSIGTEWANFTSNNGIQLIGTIDATAGALVNASSLSVLKASDSVGFSIKGFTGQTADLQQWINSTGTVLSFISASGQLGGAIAPPTTRIKVDTGNGFGSSSTAVRLFANITDNSGGVDISVVNSATLGTVFTINTTGTYCVNVNDAVSAVVNNACITVNASTLTTDCNNLALAERPVTTTPVANIGYILPYCYRFTAGDTIREINGPDSTPYNDSFRQMSVVRIN